MAELFKAEFVAGWGMMDYNGHMANRAFMDMASDTRMTFFKTHGLTMQEFMRLGIGPVVKRDELDYFREIRLMEAVTVTLEMSGLSHDASRMQLRNTFYREDGQLAAVITSSGGWLDLKQRKLVVPSPHIRDLLFSLQQTEDFETIPV